MNDGAKMSARSIVECLWSEVADDYVFFCRVSELRVVELLDGLCDKMQDYTLEKVLMILNWFLHCIMLCFLCWSLGGKPRLQVQLISSFRNFSPLCRMHFGPFISLDMSMYVCMLVSWPPSVYLLFLQLDSTRQDWIKVDNWENLSISMWLFFVLLTW